MRITLTDDNGVVQAIHSVTPEVARQLRFILDVGERPAEEDGEIEAQEIVDDIVALTLTAEKENE